MLVLVRSLRQASIKLVACYNMFWEPGGWITYNSNERLWVRASNKIPEEQSASLIPSAMLKAFSRQNEPLVQDSDFCGSDHFFY